MSFAEDGAIYLRKMVRSILRDAENSPAPDQVYAEAIDKVGSISTE